MRSFASLMMLCPTHHHQVDYLEPEKYTVDVLAEMKRRHEERAGLGQASEKELKSLAISLLWTQFNVVASEPPAPHDRPGSNPADAPHLVQTRASAIGDRHRSAGERKVGWAGWRI